LTLIDVYAMSDFDDYADYRHTLLPPFATPAMPPDTPRRYMLVTFSMPMLPRLA